MRLLHDLAKIHATFDDPHLVSQAGLVPVMALAQRAGLGDLAGEHVRIGRPCGVNAYLKVACLVAGMIAGADSIDDLGLLRHGAMPGLFGGVRAPSTLGSFLRSFTWGNVLQLQKAHREFLAGLARQAPLLPGAGVLAFVDIDSQQKRAYGYRKQGAAFGHTKIQGKSLLVRGLNVLATTICTPLAAPVIAGTRLRGGNAASARGAASMITEASFAHTMPKPADMDSLDELDRDAIARCIENNPGLVSGLKLRLVGSIVDEIGESLVDRAKEISREHHLPLTVHIGDPRAGGRDHPERVDEVTKHLLRTLEQGDILTHICTPNIGGVMDTSLNPYPELKEARANGVVLDSALGRGHFGYEIACRQAQAGVMPDTISSDLSGMGQDFHSLLECMSKFMAVGYSLSDVIRMTTVNPAKVNGLEDSLGALAVGREADITILDLVEGDFKFLDTRQNVFTGNYGLAPVQTVRAGTLHAPRWGTHPWGWLPDSD